MTFENWRNDISNQLEMCLDIHLTQDLMAEVIRYSVFPTGKLFRPLLVYCFAQDTGGITDDHKTFACSLEMHHTYTLIHDDLPAMDDDDTRRGRASSHIKFNQWKAILAGDALLNLSYKVLAKIQHPSINAIISDYGEFMGANGLILGQALDLNTNSPKLEQIIKIHELKTARLIQLAFVGSNYLSHKPIDRDACLSLGLSLGVCFQLFDDLCELTDPISEHESEINPFLQFQATLVLKTLYEQSESLYQNLERLQLYKTREYIDTYIDKILTMLQTNTSKINQHFEFNINDLKTKLGR